MAFAPGPSMGSARCYCVALQVDAEHVLIIGGTDSSFTVLATTELLDLATMAFLPGPTMQTARKAFAAVRLDAAGEEPRILVVGGHAREFDDLDDEDDEDDGPFFLSSTEILAVEVQRGAARAAGSDASTPRAPRRRRRDDPRAAADESDGGAACRQAPRRRLGALNALEQGPAPATGAPGGPAAVPARRPVERRAAPRSREGGLFGVHKEAQVAAIPARGCEAVR
eukprot:CAMPEP_0184254932 /NCGR_PEP_ID=MMETSP0977-20130417/7723_1 /TAXON_ID=483370 /ORGANISM="non described non described, Strain CCMP2097" /LENGTH=225 /DNA_ID=CAMNT_0026560489 /DNA_START=4 /DNA_END=680 /DNA_ORIENTATION=-